MSDVPDFKLAVCGSRTFPTPSLVVQSILCGFSMDTDLEVLVGDCPTGVDAEVIRWAKNRAGVSLRVFKADWSQGRKAGPLRNKEIIKAQPDLLITITDKPWTESKGSASTTRYAWAADVATLICEFYGAKP